MAGKKDVLEKTLRRLGPSRVKKMDKSVTESMYDDVSELSPAEIKALQKELDKAKVSEKKGFTGTVKGSKSLEDVERGYTPAQRRALEKELDRISRQSLEMAKGGKVPAKKMMAGGYAGTAKKMAAPTKMAMGGTKMYNKGGVGTKANCGASMKPSGGSRNK